MMFFLLQLPSIVQNYLTQQAISSATAWVQSNPIIIFVAGAAMTIASGFIKILGVVLIIVAVLLFLGVVL